MTELELLYLLLEIQWGTNHQCPSCEYGETKRGHANNCKLKEAIGFLSACLDDPELTAESWKARKKDQNHYLGGGLA